ncbi:hypothetical protein [Actinacidiphila rubida]|uniref:Uncharacterized protein n=1 Tax=Actinacidiphila rubida TaxID=310780 RepID=A0A1H8TET7_9ACTN|nr:hypothetical protein [Actinacidiphila rubida]SEO89437.1 hypothetical protein SAMN05216267_105215 [Actinacidiphila rubida]
MTGLTKAIATLFRQRLRGPAASRCVSPQQIAASPLLTELQSLIDHAARLGWLASREQQPVAYREFTADVLQMLLNGWQQQHPGGTLDDLLCEPAGTERPLHSASWDEPRSTTAPSGGGK